MVRRKNELIRKSDDGPSVRPSRSLAKALCLTNRVATSSIRNRQEIQLALHKRLVALGRKARIKQHRHGGAAGVISFFAILLVPWFGSCSFFRVLPFLSLPTVKLPLISLLALPLAAYADTFGTGGNEFTMDFITIGNAGNAADNTGYGSVGYTYRMSTYEVSRGMIDSYNALSGGLTLDMSDMTSFGGNGADKPATGISWNEAARFVNWLNTSNGYSAAYKFTTGGFNDNIALWESGDSGYDAANPFRNSNAYYFLPSEDEWYKAAYYDPSANGGLGGYWDYATGSDTAPTAVASGTTSGTAVYGQSFESGPADVDNAGGLSAYGTMAQNGNVREWSESAFNAPNDSAGESRLIRDGFWLNTSAEFVSSERYLFGGPTNQSGFYGFRVAAIPKPSVCVLTLAGICGFVLRRKRA